MRVERGSLNWLMLTLYPEKIRHQFDHMVVVQTRLTISCRVLGESVCGWQARESMCGRWGWDCKNVDGGRACLGAGVIG